MITNSNPSTREIISLVFVFLFPVYELGCHSLLYLKREDFLIRKRNLTSFYVVSLAGWIAYFTLLVSLYGGVQCGIFYVASLLIAPLYTGPQLIRALTLRGTWEYSRLMIEDEMSSRVERKKGGDSNHEGETPANSILSGSENKRHANLMMENTRKTVNMTKLALMAIPASFIILLLCLTSDIDQLLATDFDLCLPEPTLFQFASPAFGIICAALGLIAMIIAKKIDDELGLHKEITRNSSILGCTYIIIAFTRYLGYLDWQPLLQTIQQMALSFSMAILPCFPAISDLIASWASKQKRRINPATKSAVPGYARPIPKEQPKRTTGVGIMRARSSMANVQTDNRTRETMLSWDAGLCILLSTQDGVNAFSQHCAREFSAENVRFWSAVNEYKAKFDEEKCLPIPEMDDENTSDEPCDKTNDEPCDKFDANEVGKEIYRLFIAPHSDNQVNLSSKQRSEIKSSLDSGILKKETFDAAQREILSVMSRDSYPRFLASKKNRLTK